MIDGKFGFGIVGAGLVSAFHGDAINAVEEAKLVSVVDLNKERLEKFCADKGCEAAESFEAMLADDRIDVINVLTPNAYHAQFAIPAMEAKKHVVVEKPPEMTLEKVDRMIAARDANGVKCAISLQVRFRKPIEVMKAAIESGRFGRLLQGDAYMKWFRPTDYYLMDDWRSKREEGAGVTIQHAFHYIDLLYHLMGDVDSLRAQMYNLAHPEVELEDTVLAFLNYTNGAKGVVQGSTALYPGTDIRIEINGENGTAIMQGERIIVWSFRDEQEGDDAVRELGSGAIKTAAGGAADFAYFEHMYMIEDMIEAIKTGRSPRVSLESARGSLEVALAMYKSAEVDDLVSLPLG